MLTMVSYLVVVGRQSVSIGITCAASMTLILIRSFFQGLCVLGYCVAPLDIAALVACFIRIIWVRAPIAIAGWAWSVWGMCYAPIQVQSTDIDPDCSVSELLGWRKNRTAACSTCRIPTLVS